MLYAIGLLRAANMSSEYANNESGERIIAASVRPDGTVRKERRVRAGYVPQDEQPVYVSRGTQMRQNVPKCPGFAADDAGPPKPKTKAAAKNEKRKQKKLEEKAGAVAVPAGGGGDAQQAQRQHQGAGGVAQSATEAMQALSLRGGELQAAGEPPSVEKQLRALKKKIRQAEGLAARRAEGQALTPEEDAKLAKLAVWVDEERQLEAQL